MAPKLCAKCSKLVLADVWDQNVVFHPNLKSLADSAKTCAFCNLCWIQLQRGSSNDAITRCLPPGGEHAKTPVYLRGDWYPSSITNNKPSNRVNISVGILPEIVGDTNSPCYSHVTLFCDPGTPADTVLHGRYIAPDRNPTGHVAEAKRWLEICRTRHSLCNKSFQITQVSQMPKRLIYTGTGDKTSPPRIILSSSLKTPQPYIALSYCWGVGARQSIELRDANLASLFKVLPESQLSKTHAESLALTRALGVSYLWADSLCIIQGNAADWESESKRMASVYSGALLTIIASRSPDSRLGYVSNTAISALAKPVPMNFGPNPFESSPSGGGGKSLGTVHLSLTRSAAPGPVDSRAWCYQEAVLSTRSLRFCTEQVMYRCRVADLWEDGTITPSSDISDWAFQLGGPDAGTPTEVLRRWYTLLFNFSLREITEPHDVFACITSLAQLVSEKATPEKAGRYLAGIWEGDLHRGILWRGRYSWLSPAAGRARGIPLTRPRASGFRANEKKGEKIIRAPSWSWASVMGPVIFLKEERYEVRYRDRANWCVFPKRSDGKWTSPTPSSTSTTSKSASGTSSTTAAAATGQRDNDVGRPDVLYFPELELQMVGKPLRVSILRVTGTEYLATLPKKDAMKFKMKFHVYGEEILLGTFPPPPPPPPPSTTTTTTTTTATTAAAKADILAVGFVDVSEEKLASEIWALRVVKEEGLLLMRDAKGKFHRVGWFLVNKEGPFVAAKEAVVDLV